MAAAASGAVCNISGGSRDTEWGPGEGRGASRGNVLAHSGTHMGALTQGIFHADVCRITTENPGMEGTLNITHAKGHLHPDQVVPSLIQPGLKPGGLRWGWDPQGWGTLYLVVQCLEGVVLVKRES